MIGTGMDRVVSRRDLVVVAMAGVVLIVALALGATACTSDEIADPPTAAATAATTPPSTAATATDAAATVTPTATSTATELATSTATEPAPTVPLADAGIPGLDSDVAFCAAWSRFGGSWQVVLAATAFAADPADAARLEVIASTVVGDAYDAIFDVWPEELAGERAVVADAYFGAFRRRSAVASDALDDAGAEPADRQRLAEAWVDALTVRDPSDPVLAVDVPDELTGLVDAAGQAFAAQRVPLTADPSMVITAETPLTDDYLTRACPDQGAIVGGDVTG